MRSWSRTLARLQLCSTGLSLDLEAVSQALKQIAAERSSNDISTNRQVGESSQGSTGIVTGLLTRGRDGYSRIPGKHGAKAVEYAIVPVVIPDEPGELARLLTAAGVAGINVEDLTIEHVPGHPVGLVELLVEPVVPPTWAEPSARWAGRSTRRASQAGSGARDSHECVGNRQ